MIAEGVRTDILLIDIVSAHSWPAVVERFKDWQTKNRNTIIHEISFQRDEQAHIIMLVRMQPSLR